MSPLFRCGGKLTRGLEDAHISRKMCLCGDLFRVCTILYLIIWMICHCINRDANTASGWDLQAELLLAMWLEVLVGGGCGIWKRQPSQCCGHTVLTTLKTEMSTSWSTRRNLKSEPVGWWKEDSEELRRDERTTIIAQFLYDDPPSPSNLWKKMYSSLWSWARE